MISVSDLLLLSHVPQIGPQRLRALVSHFGDTGAVLAAPPRDLAAVPGISRTLASAIAASLKPGERGCHMKYAERQLARVNSCGGAVISLWDARYPEALKRIYDPPPLFFQAGGFSPADRNAVAMVGTRSPSAYAVDVAERFSRDLARLGVTVVSGLARGIDTQAHAAALDAGGRTIAVTGSGLDVIYPPENSKLCRRIIRRGVVMTEYPMGTPPDAVNFPRRNRIISGLSAGTIIIETDVDGGAMITAASALDQNREVFAVPGQVTSRRARGCHALIRDGRAKLVECIGDVVVELASLLRPAAGPPAAIPPPPDLNLFEKTVCEWLKEEPQHIDAIALGTRLGPADTLVALLGLEFKGLVKQLPGMMFHRKCLPGGT